VNALNFQINLLTKSVFLWGKLLASSVYYSPDGDVAVRVITTFAKAALLVDNMEYVGKYESFTLLGATKHGCKIFWTYVSQSVGSVLYIVSTKLSNFALKTSISRNDLVVGLLYLTWYDTEK